MHTVPPPPRESQIRALQNDPFDILIIGGGATGAGAALDAATRGLRVALVEKHDFAYGTSSRSTKLLHGGVRYLEQAVKKLQTSQLQLVSAALRERTTVMRMAPHLTNKLELITPLYTTWELPYYYTGLKLYDLLAGRASLGPSRYVGQKAIKSEMPQLRQGKLKGGVGYYDGQFDDARLNVLTITTAQEYGATVLNYVSVTELRHKGERLVGATVEDRRTGKRFEVRARAMINATGPQTDKLLDLDNREAATPMVAASSGTHIILPKSVFPLEKGMLIPKTEDGRVIFILPWQGHTLVGTTDNPASIIEDPQPTDEDVDYLLAYVNKYLDSAVSRTDVLAAWCGLRPLVRQSSANTTSQLSRDHSIFVSETGLISIVGGKWTTFRKMAEDAIDTAIRTESLSPTKSVSTHTLKLIGSKNLPAGGARTLQRNHQLPDDVAEHLYRTYGDRAAAVLSHSPTAAHDRLHPSLPYLAAEIPYLHRYEMAQTAEDVITRRLRIAVLNSSAAETIRGRVDELMQEVMA